MNINTRMTIRSERDGSCWYLFVIAYTIAFGTCYDVWSIYSEDRNRYNPFGNDVTITADIFLGKSADN